jgi:hypothetical protein
MQDTAALAHITERRARDLDARRLKGKATFLRKGASYSVGKAGRHVAQYGACTKAFRVAVVTTSEERIANMRAIEGELGSPPGLFVDRLEKARPVSQACAARPLPLRLDRE